MSTQTAINNYSNLVNSYKNATKSSKIIIKNQILSILDNANYVDFNNLKTTIKGHYYLYLGLEKDNLQAILVHSTTTPDINNIENYSPIVLNFMSNKFVANESLKTKLTADNTEITIDEYKKRVKNWEVNKAAWLQNVLDNNIMIQYFIIDQANFKNDVNNYCVFGLFEESYASKEQNVTIDLITVNDAYMDRVRPVPPFKP